MTENVAACIVTYNSERHLRPCLEALAAQTRQPRDVLVWDNASSDQSVALAEKLGATVLRAPGTSASRERPTSSFRAPRRSTSCYSTRTRTSGPATSRSSRRRRNFTQLLLALAVFVPAILFISGVRPSWAMTLTVPLLLLHLIFTMGLAFVLSSLTVYFGDVAHLTEVFLPLLFWATPILYPVEMVPGALRRWLFPSPTALFAVAYQDVLLHAHLPEWNLLVPMAGWTVGTFCSAIWSSAGTAPGWRRRSSLTSIVPQGSGHQPTDLAVELHGISEVVRPPSQVGAPPESTRPRAPPPSTAREGRPVLGVARCRPDRATRRVPGADRGQWIREETLLRIIARIVPPPAA